MFRITVRGVVQGVGFRPFVHRIAMKLGLRGYVRNTGDGSVEIVVDKDVETFLEMLKLEKPPAVRIEDVRISRVEVDLPDGFVILESGGESELSLPPPDMAVCAECLDELFDRNNRRYMYPFTSCTNCGARFAIVERLPFDRANTSLRDFPLCEDCRREYWDINDRRYYAQAFSCPKCGPNYRFIRNGKSAGWIREAAEAIEKGEIIAIKGVGGYHIACLTDDEVVARLRKILRRPQQPFAIMARNVECVAKIALLSGDEKAELMTSARPIVVVRKKDCDAFAEVAPGLDTVGVMIPYAPVHHILFEFMDCDYVVMTSANMPGEPMYVDEGVFSLGLDGYLVHNLRIANRVDDSVVKFCGGKRMVIRRSRGFVPLSVNLNVKFKALAVGAELYNSIGVLKDGKATISQYIGNTANFRTFNEYFKGAVNFFLRFLKVSKPEYVISDMHPLFNTAIFAEKLASIFGAEHLRVQHHFAHALSVMAESGLERAVAIAVDGVGYGMDGSVWGGEVLYLDLDSCEFRRIGRLESFELIGGDVATMKPIRILVSLLAERSDLLEHYSNYADVDALLKALPAGVKTTSAGRLFDAASAMLEICFERTYEGEPAMKLEAVARECEVDVKPKLSTVSEESVYSTPFSPEAKAGEVKVLKVREFFVECAERYLGGEDRGLIAYEIIAYIASGLAEIARRSNLPVVVCGGVAYNRYFTTLLRTLLGDQLIIPSSFPAGDNGISLGQLYSLKVLEGRE